MPISLSKGGNISLAKEAPGLSKIVSGLGWDARVTDGAELDLDAVAFLLNADSKVRSGDDFAFYGQKEVGGGCLVLSGDNRSGAGDGDDESIQIDLARIPADVQRIAICVTIHEADARRQNFGMVRRAYARLVDAGSDKEIARFDLSEDASLDTAMIFAEIYRNNADWKFKAVGQGFAGGLPALARSFGVDVG